MKLVKIVQATPGRVRLAIPALRKKQHLARPLEKALSALSGVEEAVVNESGGSLLLRYDVDEVQLFELTTG
ncbi:MAG: HMA2 domain-containing protein, partial [Planctomycetota bacterium]